MSMLHVDGICKTQIIWLDGGRMNDRVTAHRVPGGAVGAVREPTGRAMQNPSVRISVAPPAQRESVAPPAQPESWDPDVCQHCQTGAATSMPAARASVPGKARRARELNERQRAVLECLALGLSTKETAQRLMLSQQAVSYHIGHLLSMFSMETRTGLVAWAYAHGILAAQCWPPRTATL